MTWWGWLLVFVVIAVVGAVVLFVLARSVWRRATALFEELGTASQQLEELSARIEELEARPAPAAEDLAVFRRPQQLRQERAHRPRPAPRRSMGGNIS